MNNLLPQMRNTILAKSMCFEFKTDQPVETVIAMSDLKEILNSLTEAEKTYTCPYCKDTGKGTMTLDKTSVKVKCHYCGGRSVGD